MSSKKERTRDMIVEVSYGLFAKDGFHKITMKDICEETGLSRGGLYSHFSGTKEIFETILEMINQKDAMNFEKEMAEDVPAPLILEQALELMEYEMLHSEDSLSLAMYEYSKTVQNGMMNQFNQIFEKKWTDLIEYGIRRGEFNDIPVKEMVDVIIYAYQGIRMWSRIVTLTPDTFKSITEHIRKQLLRGKQDF